jgi:dTDP-glucose pyrophosphorylase
LPCRVRLVSLAVEPAPSVLEPVAQRSSIAALQRSPRGEYEMTDVIASYARERRLAHAYVHSSWIDVGTLGALQRANNLLAAAVFPYHSI